MGKGNKKKTVSSFLATSMAAHALVPVLPVAASAEAVATDLMISEYIEGSGFNKALELYNVTAHDIDLSEYTLELYSNGATEASQSVQLEGNLASGDTYILYHGQADESIQTKGNQASSRVINFNGDDAIVLKKAGKVIDSIGEVGKRDTFGKDTTLVRNPSVTTGDTTLDDAFETNEWTSHAKDTFDHLGTHVMDGSAGEVDPENPPEEGDPVQAVTASHASGTIPVGTEVELTTSTSDAQIYYTTNGEDPREAGQLYEEPIVVDRDMTVKAYVAKDGLEDSAVNEFDYIVYDVEEGLEIHDLQGETHDSPFDNKTVEDIQGVVTYKYELGGNYYFHFQTPDELKDNNPKTSEGMVVFTGNQEVSVNVGDLVSVTGEVDEYHIDGYYDTKQETDLPVTQINARDDRGGMVTVVEKDVRLPEPVEITSENLPREVIDNDGFTVFDPEEDAIDFWESLEGMRVEVGNVKAIAPQEHGDLFTVLEERETDTLHGGVLLTADDPNPDRISFKLYDNEEARDFEVATGDTFEGPMVGVVNYGFQNYKIYADYEELKDAHVVGDAEPEQTTLEWHENKLTIASYNLENFSNNKSETSDDKAAKLARAFVKDMKSPDVIGVTEVQDNNGQDAGDSAADESYERLIQAIVDAGGPRYEYANIDPEVNQDGGAPNANIRVGFLYNPERVSLTDGLPAGDATTAVGYEDGQLTHNPGRIDPTNEAFEDSRKPLAAQFEFQGEEVVVIVNHWKSKSGDTPLFGSTQPPVYGSEEQRKAIADTVYGFVEEIKADNPDANIVSVGDFNDFQFSDALKIHEGDHMTNMINHVEEKDRYTYLYQGNSQVLDHILVSNNLVDATEIDILHINADFTDMAGRASDHDPVMVQVDLKDTGDADVLDDAVLKAQEAIHYFDRASYFWSADEERQTKLDEARSAVEAVRAIDPAYDTSAWEQILDDAQQVIEETIALEQQAEKVNEALRNLSYDDPFGEYILTDEALEAAKAEYNDVKGLYDEAVEAGATMYMFDLEGLNALEYQKRKIDTYPHTVENVTAAVQAVENASFHDLGIEEDTDEAKLAAVQEVADLAIDEELEDRMTRNTVETVVTYNEDTNQYDIVVKSRDWGLSRTVSVAATFAGEQEEIIPENVYQYNNLKRGKLVINEPSVSVTLNGKTDIKNGVDFRGNYGVFDGEGFERATVSLNPKSGEAIIDFNGTIVEKVIIRDKFGGSVKEIRGAENIKSLEFTNGVDENAIQITDSNGKLIEGEVSA
ncbi:chitobiase/beta-hexosaminidase C-terminal domain-containing protein [Oceanobacillus senegalensis]|uniref:chitobiase/beta-hexosaminidase C-terminal domain-containing protein n=1 Tax=Oceanobacillus senegalensis TaxID=1936063 RepID=UPI000A30AA01|nr:chitobiase/beta-hexosaminidase C-terminal domain-containing protein [Oceanobacillus senegalensis]